MSNRDETIALLDRHGIPPGDASQPEAFSAFRLRNPRHVIQAHRLLTDAGIEPKNGRAYSDDEYQRCAAILREHGVRNFAAALPAQSDARLAHEVVTHHRNRLRYADGRGWYVWDGRQWQPNASLDVQNCILEHLEEVAAGLDDPRTAAGITSAKTAAAVERLARSDRRIRAHAEEFDADPLLLNTPSGVVDLRTGKRRPHRAADLLTRMTRVAPAPAGTPCPQWLAALDRWKDDGELIAFEQRALGYALTGETREHALFFAHGSGANGKTTMFSTLSYIFGDYCVTASPTAFMESRYRDHPTEIARLQGARFVLIPEIDDGQRWDQGMLSRFTGGDRVAARFMRGDLFEFRPECKLFFVGNYRPGLRNVNESMRRRFHLLPFPATIPPEARDPGLAARLRKEAPAILRWLIDGCLAWQREGLAPPATVRAATDAYLAGADAVLSWIDDCCERDPAARTPRTRLFDSWRRWCEESRESVGTARRLYDRLDQLGFRPYRTSNARGFEGIRPVADADAGTTGKLC